MLYGDWGTSRFYVLGLAFYFALYSSFYYILAVGVLVAAVGWAYTVVCRAYPDGGGVYSAARQVSPTLSVVGALLLFADYAVTAALSAFEGLHYFGVESSFWVQVGAIGSILILGVINYIGPRRAGTFALIIAMATLVLTLILVGFAIPHLGTGWANIKPPQEDLSYRWVTFTSVVLALSGVEAVANMTGIMVNPVSKTSKKSIYPVLIEVVLFNIILGVAMMALPAMLHARSGPGHDAEFQRAAYKYEKERKEFVENNPGFEKDPVKKAQYEAMPEKSENEERIQKVVMRVMGEEFVGAALGPKVGNIFGIISGAVFGLLLLSAVNTVIGGMVSVGYVMGRDRELPSFFTKLNMFGVPWVGLIPALVVPAVLLMMFTELDTLADLYAIGVVGAIAINLTCCTINKKLPVKTYERVCIGLIAAVMIAIELTLAYNKPHALFFVLIIMAVGLGLRYLTKNETVGRKLKVAKATAERMIEAARETEEEVAVSAYGTPPEQLDMGKAHVMVAARGSQRLLDFAATYAKQLDGILFVIFVRQLNVAFSMGATGPSLEEDREARGVFEMAAKACKANNVAMVPIYVVSNDVAYSILDFAATYDVKALLMGVSRKGAVMRALQGDVLTNVADNLPPDIPLLIHA